MTNNFGMNQLLAKIKLFLPDGFVAGIILMVLLGYLFPGFGQDGSTIELAILIKYAIVLLFFFYGIRLSPENMKDGLGNIKLHLTIQLITFVLFPVIVLITYPFFKSSSYYDLWLAVFYLAALPSTVSSSVVMVSIARGNIPGSIFNASISGILGILITPLWMSLFLSNYETDFRLLLTIRNLFLQILTPLLLGLFLHKYLTKWTTKFKRFLGIYDKTVVLVIVYHSFSNSFISGVFAGIPNWTLFVLAAVVILLFFFYYFLVKKISIWMKFKREDQITVIFNGTKKSLVHGSVMASVLFGSTKIGSLFLVPIMIFHVFQLTMFSIIARKFGKENR